MGKIQVRANYRSGTKRGSIKVSEIAKQSPAEYEITLIDDKKGPVGSKNTATMPEAIAWATKFGFLSYLWVISDLEY